MKVVGSVVVIFSSVFTLAHGQGLLSIGPQVEAEGKWPWTVKLTSSFGWDSNPNAGSQGGSLPASGTSGRSDQGSSYLQNDINLAYSKADRISQLRLTADYSSLWYMDTAPGVQSTSNNWRLSLDYVRKQSRQLTISDTFYIAHQTQPDFSVGLTVGRPTTGSLVTYNNLSLNYAMSRAWSAVSSYSLTNIRYDDVALQSEDYLQNLFSEQLRYAITRRSTLTADLRYELTQYEHNPDGDSMSQFLLVGIDHQFNRRLQGSVSGGLEFRQYDGPLGSRIAPSFESSLNYHAGKYTTWRWYASLGLNDTGNAGVQSGYSYQTGLTLQQELTARLVLSISVNGMRTNFSGGPVGVADEIQQTISASVNLSYAIWRNVSLTAGYTYSDVSQGNGVIDSYNRQQVTLGISATF